MTTYQDNGESYETFRTYIHDDRLYSRATENSQTSFR